MRNLHLRNIVNLVSKFFQLSINYELSRAGKEEVGESLVDDSNAGLGYRNPDKSRIG